MPLLLLNSSNKVCQPQKNKNPPPVGRGIILVNKTKRKTIEQKRKSHHYDRKKYKDKK